MMLGIADLMMRIVIHETRHGGGGAPLIFFFAGPGVQWERVHTLIFSCSLLLVTQVEECGSVGKASNQRPIAIARQGKR